MMGVCRGVPHSNARRLGGVLAGVVLGESGRMGRERVDEGVVPGVGKIGAILDLVEVVVVVDLLAQLSDPLRGIRARHGRQDNTLISGILAALRTSDSHTTASVQ